MARSKIARSVETFKSLKEVEGLLIEVTRTETERVRAIDPLVQILDIPRPTDRTNPFTGFGVGGHGGLNDKAWNLVSDAFSFHYMGDAVFEYGSVNTALAKICDYAAAGKLIKGTMHIGEDEIFYLCHEEMKSETKRLIGRFARRENFRWTRHYVGLADALEKKDRKEGDHVGWLDINNNFMFFIDRTMFEKTAKIMEQTQSK